MAKNYIFTDGTVTVRCGTEREAIWEFCEALLEDSSNRYQQYSVGTKLEVRKGDQTLISYKVGYTCTPKPVAATG